MCGLIRANVQDSPSVEMNQSVGMRLISQKKKKEK